MVDLKDSSSQKYCSTYSTSSGTTSSSSSKISSRKIFSRDIIGITGCCSSQYGYSLPSRKPMQYFSNNRDTDVISWTAMIDVYRISNLPLKALQLFRQMQQEQQEHLRLDRHLITSILSACGDANDLEEGKEIHRLFEAKGIKLDARLGTALVTMYGKCGSSNDAYEHVFQTLLENGIADRMHWNAMIAAYQNSNHPEKALQLFRQMRQDRVPLSSHTLASVLAACADTMSIDEGKEVHQIVQMETRFAQKAIEIFKAMLEAGLKPNPVTFVCLLNACSHAGLVEEAYHYFHTMETQFGIAPTVVHHICMVDVLSRAGRLDEAELWIEQYKPEPTHIPIWTSLLSGCCTFHDIERAERIFQRAVAANPGAGSFYILMANLYNIVGRPKDAERVSQLLNTPGIKKPPGISFIEINGQTHSFRVSDNKHPEMSQLRQYLQTIEHMIRDSGYVPDTNFITNNSLKTQQQKEQHLCEHSERLAIGYGMMKTPPHTTLLVGKNLRVCPDCHAATKLMSKVTERNIIVRDASRFHVFTPDGRGSCNDYW